MHYLEGDDLKTHLEKNSTKSKYVKEIGKARAYMHTQKVPKVVWERDGAKKHTLWKTIARRRTQKKIFVLLNEKVKHYVKKLNIEIFLW